MKLKFINIQYIFNFTHCLSFPINLLHERRNNYQFCSSLYPDHFKYNVWHMVDSMNTCWMKEQRKVKCGVRKIAIAFMCFLLDSYKKKTYPKHKRVKLQYRKGSHQIYNLKMIHIQIEGQSTKDLISTLQRCRVQEEQGKTEEPSQVRGD